jgi:hypothetical protein
MEKWDVLAGSATAEMLNPNFWGGTDKVLMTAEQVEEYNRYLRGLKGTGLVSLQEFPLWLSGEEVRQMVELYPLCGRFLEGSPITTADYQELLEERNLEALPGKVSAKYGIIQSAADLRSFPTSKICTAEGGTPDETAFDLLQETQLSQGEGVIVLHPSKSGNWLFVQGANYFGWVERGNILPCSRSEFLTELNKPTEILPFTTKQFYRTALSNVGTPYRWGRFDCSALLCRVYERFGIALPRNSSRMAVIQRGRKRIVGDPRNVLSQLSPGSLLFFPGHSMLYLGMVEGEPYVLQTLTRYFDPEGKEHPVFTTAVTSLSNLYHTGGESFLERLTLAVEVQ